MAGLAASSASIPVAEPETAKTKACDYASAARCHDIITRAHMVDCKNKK